ncbi:MAG: hypothetical protein V4706_01760 [Pseudomonadota bacterium]
MSRLTFIQTRSNKRIELLARNPVFRAVGRQPMPLKKRENLLLAAHEAFESAQRGTANDADRDTLVCMVNVAMVLAGKHCIAEDLADVLAAQDALLRADLRKLQGKGWNFDGEGRKAILVALSSHEQQIAQLGQAAVTDALLVVREMRAKGEVHQVGVAA